MIALLYQILCHLLQLILYDHFDSESDKGVSHSESLATFWKCHWLQNIRLQCFLIISYIAVCIFKRHKQCLRIRRCYYSITWSNPIRTLEHHETAFMLLVMFFSSPAGWNRLWKASKGGLCEYFVRFEARLIARWLSCKFTHKVLMYVGKSIFTGSDIHQNSSWPSFYS